MVNESQHSHKISFNDDKSKFLILNLMWDYVLDYHQKIYDEHINYYLDCKKEIEMELKTLKRDKNLKKLLQD